MKEVTGTEMYSLFLASQIIAVEAARKGFSVITFIFNVGQEKN